MMPTSQLGLILAGWVLVFCACFFAPKIGRGWLRVSSAFVGVTGGLLLIYLLVVSVRINKMIESLRPTDAELNLPMIDESEEGFVVEIRGNEFFHEGENQSLEKILEIAKGQEVEWLLIRASEETDYELMMEVVRAFSEIGVKSVKFSTAANETESDRGQESAETPN